MSLFQEVKLVDWDSSKVKIGKHPKDGTPSLLYDGKMPILVVTGNTREDKYVLSSYKGLTKKNKFDDSTKKYTDAWTGEWEISFKICDSIDGATPLQRKLMDIFDDIVTKMEEAFEDKVKFSPVSYKWHFKENSAGVLKKDKIDTSKGAYVKAKVGYAAPKDAEQITIDSKHVPVFEARYPKADFFDITRARDQIKITHPDPECHTPMRAVPKIMLFARPTPMGLFFTKIMKQCYYEPMEAGGSGIDDGLIDELRGAMDDIDLEVEY